MSEELIERRSFMKFGSVLAVVGGTGYFLTLLLHGDLPDETTETALLHIAGRPEWVFLKISLIFFSVCWIGAFIAITKSLSNTFSKELARFATGVLTIGVAILVIHYSIIGYALKGVADSWNSASGEEIQAYLNIAEVLLTITGSLFHNFIAWKLGLPFILLGSAIVLEIHYSNWIGWFAIIAGSGAFIAGITRFIGLEFIPYPLLYGGFVIPLNLWLVFMGMRLWKDSKSTSVYF